jgi:hypothetical protein
MNKIFAIVAVAVFAAPSLAIAAPVPVKGSIGSIMRPSSAGGSKLIRIGSVGTGKNQRFINTVTTVKPEAAKDLASMKPVAGSIGSIMRPASAGGPKLITIGSVGSGSGQRFVDTVSTVK